MSAPDDIDDILDEAWDLLDESKPDAARTGFLRALELAEDDEIGAADAHHGLGFVCQLKGDAAGTIKHWLETRRLDLIADLPSWHLPPAEFSKVAEAALAELPPEVIERLRDVPILIDEVPSEAQVKDGIDPRFLGLFSGLPLPEKSSIGEQSGALDTIHLFQFNLERSSESREHLCEEIRITVLHETAHFFGLDDEDLEELGLG